MLNSYDGGSDDLEQYGNTWYQKIPDNAPDYVREDCMEQRRSYEEYLQERRREEEDRGPSR